MGEGITVTALATSALAVGYAAWWVIRHELAVRRFRAELQKSDHPENH